MSFGNKTLDFLVYSIYVISRNQMIYCGINCYHFAIQEVNNRSERCVRVQGMYLLVKGMDRKSRFYTILTNSYLLSTLNASFLMHFIFFSCFERAYEQRLNSFVKIMVVAVKSQTLLLLSSRMIVKDPTTISHSI